MIGSLQTEEERTLLEKLTWLLTAIVNVNIRPPPIINDPPVQQAAIKVMIKLKHYYYYYIAAAPPAANDEPNPIH